MNKGFHCVSKVKIAMLHEKNGNNNSSLALVKLDLDLIYKVIMSFLLMNICYTQNLYNNRCKAFS